MTGLRLLFILCLSAMMTGPTAIPGRAEFILTKEKNQEDDLAFGGAFTGLAPDEVRYASRRALAALPGVKVVREEAVPRAGEADLTVLPLATLLEALPMAGRGDALVLVCSDRWETFIPAGFVRSHRPYLLLYYNGKSPDEEPWPMFGGNIEPLAPYYVYVSSLEVPGYVDDTPYGMVSATQIVEFRVVNGKDRYAPFHAPPLDRLGALADEGRKLFLRRCNSCHQGPAQVGGNVSQRPFLVLQTHARHNPDFFRSVVTDPKAIYPGTIMPRHPDFGDREFSALIAFLTETMAAGVQ